MASHSGPSANAALNTDAGLSRPLLGKDDLVQVGNAVGTISYTAPETLTENVLQKPSDVYAFGILSTSYPWHRSFVQIVISTFDSLKRAKLYVNHGHDESPHEFSLPGKSR